VIRRESAGRGRIGLDLESRVLNPELFFQMARNFHKVSAAGPSVRNDHVTGKRNLSRAHRPDMQIMHLNNAAAFFEIAAEGGELT
jgi:hypothetical protein